jgi:hypothetical protein
MDSPVGTGFSYATSDEGLKSSDTKAVRQLAIFLRKVRRQRPWSVSNDCTASVHVSLVPYVLNVDHRVKIVCQR